MSKLVRLLFPATVLLLVSIPAMARADVHVRARGNVYWGWTGVYVGGGSDYYGDQPTALGTYDAYGRRVYVQYASPPPPPAPPPQPQPQQYAQGCCAGCCGCQQQCAPPPAPPAPPPPPQPYYPPQPEPQQPQGWYAPAPPPQAYYPEPAVAYAPEKPPLRTLGIGLRASSTSLDRGDGDSLEGSGGGLLLRLRGERLAVEFDLGGEEYTNGRSDGRFGATLYLHLNDGTLVPYGLVGLGLNTVHYAGMPEDDPWVQGYVEAGGGAGLNLGTHWFLSADLRFSARSLSEDQHDDDYYYQGTRALPPNGYYSPDRPEDETGVELRLAAHLFF